MRDESQFDLLDAAAGRPPALAAEVIPFPLARRRKTIARVAETLANRKTEDGQQSYWSRTIAGLGAELRRHGADQVEIDRQLDAFHRAVTDVLARRQAQPSNPRPAA